IREDLRAETEFAERPRMARTGRLGVDRVGSGAELAPEVALRRDVQDYAGARAFDGEDGLAEVRPAVERRRAEEVGDERARVYAAEHRLFGRAHALGEREDLPRLADDLVDARAPLAARHVEPDDLLRDAADQPLGLEPILDEVGHRDDEQVVLLR